ncbi:MAG: transketolase [Calditrichaeota bacterium]|nr:MAG: transketolase [Calditrichota bacterium]
MNEISQLDIQCINTIRTLSIDAIQKANSGHPGLPMGAAPMAYVLWDRFLKHNPNDPSWPNRDRFILSGGHGSMLVYSLLHLSGYDLSLDDLKNFRQWGSKTPGHPETGEVPGVETTTGPLGQGFANGIGMAIAEAHLAAIFNKPGLDIVDFYTYAILGDGDLMEGLSAEAASLAGTLKLGKLIYFYDDNHISIEGDTKIAFTEDRVARFDSYGWHTQTIEYGNDPTAFFDAIKNAKNVTDKPSLIAARTTIGCGAPNKAGTASIHGEPLGAEEIKATKRALNLPENEDFYIADDVLTSFRKAVQRGSARQQAWEKLFAEYKNAHPKLAAEFNRRLAGDLPLDWAATIPDFQADTKGTATRASGGQVLNAIADNMPELIGGSADLAPSTKTLMKCSGDFLPGGYENRNMHFGVRENAMASICNGIALTKMVRPYCSTFLIFSDYLRPSLRLTALMKLPVLYILTHDSIGVGEDGPTHQPIEHFAALRSIPNVTFIRPCDANEVAVAWKTAIEIKTGPVILALTRQNLPTLDRNKYGAANATQKGAYILQEAENNSPELILIATGSEVHPTLRAAEILQNKGVATRVVSMPSMELFEAQPHDYKNEILPATIKKRVAIEAGISQCWEKYVGDAGTTVAIDNEFGKSGPANTLFEKYGFTAENIAAKALEIL